MQIRLIKLGYTSHEHPKMPFQTSFQLVNNVAHTKAMNNYGINGHRNQICET